MFKVGHAQSFWGDRDSAAAELIQKQPDLDFITFDYLAEVSLSIMAAQREKDPSMGYAEDFIRAVEKIIPFWMDGSEVRLISNAGGLAPKKAAQALMALLWKHNCVKNIYVVEGDDVTSHFKNEGAYTANAYLGADGIKTALDRGADIVITGRVADPSLVVAAAAHHYQWRSDQYQQIAGATIAGHILECGTQATGGICTHWLQIPDPAHIGYPIAEIHPDGSSVITKPPKTGGVVNLMTVKEQLLYELGDPAHYLSPDATVSFLGLDVKQVGLDRVEVRGAIGYPPPATYKVSATFRNGYRSEATLVLTGDQLPAKARRTREVILTRLKDAGWTFTKVEQELFGCDDHRALLRLAVAHDDEAAVKAFAREIAPLVCCGAQGTTGYLGGRPNVRAVYGFKSLLIDRNQVKPVVSAL
jgi:hypothetical protein